MAVSEEFFVIANGSRRKQRNVTESLSFQVNFPFLSIPTVTGLGSKCTQSI